VCVTVMMKAMGELSSMESSKPLAGVGRAVGSRPPPSRAQGKQSGGFP